MGRKWSRKKEEKRKDRKEVRVNYEAEFSPQSGRIFGTWEKGWRSGENARLSPMGPGSIPGPGVICELSLLVFFLAPRSFSPGDPVYHSPQETNISKFQLDLDICQALNHEPLARVIAQALPVFDIYFYIYFTVFLCEV